ncbi:dUTP diphosphatase [Kroppenstedtia eburnea]|uniref:Dimeric dUTPase, all-alpha-NTP-PPase (MazG) superfamily n=1 Tax=Kroppenstedtia eburnea TaxID=714067 RepID=A0A1N7JGE7_9BACL|nr:dUTP diphosphatase [Kroppenstedtia eburnea]QKI80565.1 hypothetical protein GXN75_00190 [Kroppenstedtia eburnea]SIS48389.1 Dimeric dUTPase, all-alpha-NTP-PPase (MazG) superfamily [Kroppenstedtia eburnea]
MNLAKLFELQKELDDRIIDKKGLKGQNLLPNKILALQVELGELANEWRGFKHWSNDQTPRIRVEIGACKQCAGTGKTVIGDPTTPDCWSCDGEGEEIKNPLLEEYVDCLHFILSIGLELDMEEWSPYFSKIIASAENEITIQFQDIFRYTCLLRGKERKLAWDRLAAHLLGLADMLGFTWEDVEAVYIRKNRVNHFRQTEGY